MGDLPAAAEARFVAWKKEQVVKWAATEDLRQEYTETTVRKAKARASLQSAVRRGKVIKPSTCERCHATNVPRSQMQAHHHDYTKPLAVEWICQPCHNKEHRGGWAATKRSSVHGNGHDN